MLMHKLGNVVVNNTDNLLISSFVGVITAGIYSNYYLVIGSIRPGSGSGTAGCGSKCRKPWSYRRFRESEQDF